MVRPFDDSTRRQIAGRCAVFARAPAGAGMAGLKRAAVAITLVAGEDCAGTAVFLLSPASAYVVGHVVVVDGGLTVGQIGRM